MSSDDVAEDGGVAMCGSADGLELVSALMVDGALLFKSLPALLAARQSENGI